MGLKFENQIENLKQLAKRVSFMFGLYQGGKNVEKEQQIDTNSVKCNTPTRYHGLSLILMNDMLHRNKNVYDMRHHPFPFLKSSKYFSQQSTSEDKILCKTNTLKWIFLQVKAILQHKVSFIKIVFLHNEDAINLLQLPDQPICGLLPISAIDSDVLSKFSPPYH